jgi:hypothetical protein
MDRLDETRAIEFLLRATPESVFEWFEKRPKCEPGERFFKGQLSKAFEDRLLGRKEELVDLALALNGTNRETSELLYSRWCSRAVVAEWPPRPHSFSYSILASLISNVNAPLLAWSESVPGEELEWLIENGSLDDGLFGMFFSNPAPALGYLRALANREGVYGRLDDDRWLFALAILGDNKGLHVANRDNEHGPDMHHWDIHENFVRAAEVSPKTPAAAVTLGYLFSCLPLTATDDTYVNDEKIRAAVDSWNMEVVDDPKDKYSSLKYMRDEDGMGPSERIRFHLLRHYEIYLRLDPDDQDRVRRLAAYAKNTVGAGKPFSTGSDGKWKGKALDETKWKQYADRDGAAFMFASSYNKHIWSVPKVAEKIQDMEFACEQPKDPADLHRNRRDAGAPKDDQDDPEEKVDSVDQLHQKFVEWAAESKTMSAEVLGRLEGRLANLKVWLVAVAILALLLLFLKH